MKAQFVDYIYIYIFFGRVVRNGWGEIYVEGLSKIMRSLSRYSDGVRVWGLVGE